DSYAGPQLFEPRKNTSPVGNRRVGGGASLYRASARRNGDRKESFDRKEKKAMSIALDQFCEIENGAVRSVDISKLSHLQKAERPADGLRLIRTQARPADAMAQLQRLLVLARPENMALVPRDQFALARLPEFSSTGV